MDKIFEALASTTRRKILALLSKATLTAGDISEKFDISKPSLSKHLGILENAGLVRKEKKGQFVHYSLVEGNLINTINDFITDFCPVARPLKKDGKILFEKNKK